MPAILRPPEPGFTIEITRDFVEVVYRGLWTVETCEELRAAIRDLEQRLANLSRPMETQAVLIDMVDFAIQPKAIADRLMDVASKREGIALSRAVVTRSFLMRSQIRRILDDVAFFDDRAQAVEWLVQDVARRRAVPHPAGELTCATSGGTDW